MVGLLQLLFNKKLIAGIVIIILFVTILYIAVTYSPPPTRGASQEQVTVNINRAIGIDYITINNLDAATGKFVKTYIQLPYSFNCTSGDALEFSGTTQTGYAWNGWQFSTGHFMTNNPLTIISSDSDYAIKNTITITPCCYSVYVPPSATATPTITAAPTGWGPSK